MGHPAYEARREAELAEAAKRKSSAEASTAAFDALTDFLTGKASLHVSSMQPGIGMSIRLVRDQK